MKTPTTLPDGGFDPAARRKINEIIRVMGSLEIRNHPDIEIDRTANGVFIRPKGGGTSSDSNNQAPRWG